MSLSTRVKTNNDQLLYLKSLAKIASDSKQYSNQSEASLLNLMLSAQDLGISPMKAINGGFYIVNGKVCMSTSLMADRIRKAGHSVKIVAMTRDKCVISAVRKDNGDSISLEYTIEEASLAGLTNSPTWKKYPKLMLYNRCMSSVARILFSDVIGNTYSEEERFDIQNIDPNKRPLEPQDDDIVVANAFDQEVPQEKLAKEQEDLLADAISQLSGEDYENLIRILGIQSIFDIQPKDFDRVLKSINKKVASSKETQEEAHE